MNERADRDRDPDGPRALRGAEGADLGRELRQRLTRAGSPAEQQAFAERLRGLADEDRSPPEDLPLRAAVMAFAERCLAELSSEHPSVAAAYEDWLDAEERGTDVLEWLARWTNDAPPAG